MASCGGHRPLVNLFAIVFGIGAWVSINGIWVELPLLVQLPEGWALPSYLSVIIQIANIGPITYSTIKVLWPRTTAAPIIYIVLAIGCLSSLLLALFWQETTLIGGNLHSTALLILVFFLSLVDCTSSVLYLPYMGEWKKKYLPFYSFGEGLSGLLPALVALAQGVGNTDGGGSSGGDNSTSNSTINDTDFLFGDSSGSTGPNFSVTVFFLILFAMMVASATAFTLLDLLPNIQSERTNRVIQNDLPDPVVPETITEKYSPHASYNGEIQTKKVSTVSEIVASAHDSSASSDLSRPHDLQDDNHSGSEGSNSLLVDENNTFEWPRQTLYFLLFGQLFASSLTNGFLPSIQSYSCGPYGDNAYHLAATLSSFANPCAALTTAVAGRAKPAIIGVMLTLGSMFATYLIVTASMSPYPPLVGTDGGTVLVVLSWIFFTYLLSFVRVEINNLLRLTGGSRGGKMLFLSGAATQTGSFIGAVIAFMLVNVAHVFKG